MWVVILGIMALIYIAVLGCGGHVLHQHDGGPKGQQPAAKTQAESFHRHNTAADTGDGRDKDNHGQVISGGQSPESGAGGTPEACSEDPDRSAEGDACSAADGNNSFFQGKDDAAGSLRRGQ